VINSPSRSTIPCRFSSTFLHPFNLHALLISSLRIVISSTFLLDILPLSNHVAKRERPQNENEWNISFHGNYSHCSVCAPPLPSTKCLLWNSITHICFT
jgi:hypothetical protein